MTARIQFFPIGNADSLRLDLADGRKVLVDYAAVKGDGDDEDKRCDLSAELRRDLKETDRNHFDAVCITHVDSDHCKGFGDFFWLEHAEKYQEDDRVKISELWVPAAAILETNLKNDARLVREEARHRLRNGKGVRVFSRPERLREWLEDEGFSVEDRENLIVDAGKFIPKFRKDGPEKVEFFVHCPFGWRQDENTVVDRNEDSIVMHATFEEGGRESRLFLGSDADHETLSAIVQTSCKHGNDDRLGWDIMKLPHHCSYLSIGPDRGEEETKPDPDVRWLFENKREEGSYIVSPSEPIPAKGSDEDESDQPPHRQAASYHRRISSECDGKFEVTMENPSKARPEPFAYKITSRGITPELSAPMISTSAAASTPRAG